MSLSLIAAIKALVLPPTINFILVIAGWLLYRRFRSVAIGLQLAGVLSLLLLSLAPVSYALIQRVETYPALPVPVVLKDEKAIVVLGAGINADTPEFGRSIDSEAQLQRLHYASFLYQQTGLPLLVTGGYVDTIAVSEAEVMQLSLKNSFNIKKTWVEQQSQNTAENALYSAQLLKAQGVEGIFLVTHAHHMARAVKMFAAQGLAVTPAPTSFTRRPDYSEPDTWLPSVDALYTSVIALHEHLGMFWYRLRY